MNRLAGEKAAYLKHSAYQKIDWYPWSDEAFEQARQEDKPVFLSSGAVWCHWCHVMAEECFEDQEIIKLLNENFISIKLDRDERPEVDRRYQRAVAAMGSGGGWPLSVFLTPDRKPFFGGTYFPPEDSFGRPGFKKVLRSIVDSYRSERDEISGYSQRLMNSLKPNRASHGEISESLINDAVASALSQFDPQNGGFGSSPKFPMQGTIEFLTNRFFFSKKEPLGYAVKKTLMSMAKGGFHDQIGGGFHRYSVDKAWIVPHFEKMADDNAWLLRNYIDAYSLFKDEYFREVAEGIINFIGTVLSDPDGGFYASQDADVSPRDEGGYFTWTDEEFRRALDDKEYSILSLHLLNDRGEMHHDRSKKVLFVSMSEGQISERVAVDVQTVSEIIKRGKEKLLRERNKRNSPFIDRTFYTSLNGMLISSLLRAFQVTKDNRLRDFSLKSLLRIMTIHFINKELFHSEGIRAILDDYIHLIDALISAYEITGESSHLNQADQFMELCINKFWDGDKGGFFDTESEILGTRLKEIEDIPHPSANSLGIILLLKLYYMTGKKIYHQYAEKSLKTFSSRAKDMGINSGYYFCATDAYFNMLKLTLQTTPASELAETVLSFFRPYVSMFYGEDKSSVIPCLKEICFEPIYDPAGLRDFLRGSVFQKVSS